MELITTPTHDVQREETEQEEKKYHSREEDRKGKGCDRHLGAQNGRAAIRQSRVHPNDRNLASWIPLWEGTSHLQSIFEGGYHSLTQVGSMRRRPQAFSTTKKNTQTQHRTHRHSNHTHPSRTKKTPRPFSPPPSRCSSDGHCGNARMWSKQGVCVCESESTCVLVCTVL